MSNNTMKNYTKTKADRAWFSCLVQHGPGLSLQPRSLHRAGEW